MSTAAARVQAPEPALELPPPVVGQHDPTVAHLRLVEPGPRRHALGYLLASVALIVLTVLAAVGLNALAAADAVQARDLERAVTVGQREYAHLVADVARLSAPERIRTKATELGMVPAVDPVYLRVDGPPSTTLPGSEGSVLGTDAGDPLKPVLSVQR